MPTRHLPKRARRPDTDPVLGLSETGQERWGGIRAPGPASAAQEERSAAIIDATVASVLEGYVPPNAGPLLTDCGSAPDAGGADGAAGAGGKADVWATCDAKRKGVVKYVVAPGNLDLVNVNAAKKVKKILDGLESSKTKSLKLHNSHMVWTCSCNL